MELSVEMIADLVINIVSVIVLFLVVTKLGYKPVKKFMDTRTERVMADKKKAEEMLKEAEEKEAKYTELLENSEKASREAVRQGEEKARVEAGKIIDTAEKKAESIIQNAEKKAEEKYKKTVQNAEDEIVDISIDVAEKLLSREITDADNRKIVREFLDTLE